MIENSFFFLFVLFLEGGASIDHKFKNQVKKLMKQKQQSIRETGSLIVEDPIRTSTTNSVPAHQIKKKMNRDSRKR